MKISGQVFLVSNREHQRQKLILTVSLISGGEATECKIQDISVGGAKIVASKPFEKGTEVKLQLQNFGDFQGKIVWRDQNYHGLQFMGDPADIAETLAAMALYG